MTILPPPNINNLTTQHHHAQEFLSEPAQIAMVGRELCFVHEQGTTPIVAPVGAPEGTKRAVPDFKPKRPAGGHNGERPKNWAPTAHEMALLTNANKLDIELYAWAREIVRGRLARDFPQLPLCDVPPCETRKSVGV